MAEYEQTQGNVARKVGISRATFIELSKLADFPKRTKRGWNVEKVRAFLQKNGRGPYRQGSGGAPTSIKGVTLTEARTRYTIEQAANEKIKKERQLVEQAMELREIVSMDDVRRIYGQTVATVSAVDDSLLDAVDRSMPEVEPSADAWKEIRVRVLELVKKHRTDTAAAMMELV